MQVNHGKHASARLAGIMIAAVGTLILTLLVTERAYGQASAEQTKLDALKQSIQASAVALRQYEWVETQVVFLKGEQKSSKQSRCYYGADGGVQKTLISEESGGGRKPRGLRKRAAKNKTEDITEYIGQAMALVKQYVPPDPQKIQSAQDAGRTTLSVHDSATRMRLKIPDYIKAGDALSVDVDPNNDRLLGISVLTYLAKPGDVVTLDVKFGTLNDGTSYPAEIVFDGTSEKIKIVISNSGYKKSGS